MSWLIDPVVLWAVAARFTGLVVLLPALPGINIPRSVRAGLVVWLSLLISPLLAPVPLSLTDPIGLSLLIVGEFLIGLGCAFSIKLVFAAIETGAALIENELGLTAAQQYNPLLGQQAGAVVSLWSLIAIGYYWILGYFPLTLGALRGSFEIVPLGQLSNLGGIGALLSTAGGIFSGALLVAAPIVAVGFVVNIGLGLAGKAVQQMNIFSEGFAIRLVAIGFALLAFLPLLLLGLRTQLEKALPAASGFLRALAV